MRTTRGEWGGKIRRRDVSRTVTHRVGLGKRRNQTYRGGLVRRLITACNEFEWRGAHETSLSRKGCDMLADVVHESLEITEYRYHPSFSRPSLSLSLSFFRINPLAAHLLSRRPPTPPLAPPYPTLGHLSRTRFYARNRFNPAR